MAPGYAGGVRPWLLARAALVALCVAGLVASVIAHRSERRLDVLLLPLDERPWNEETRTFIRQARPLNPDSRIDQREALLLQREGRSREADAAMARAAEREPENALVWGTWLLIENDQGDRAGARRAEMRARALDSQLRRSPPGQVAP